jgi:hypothetical protein
LWDSIPALRSFNEFLLQVPQNIFVAPLNPVMQFAIFQSCILPSWRNVRTNVRSFDILGMVMSSFLVFDLCTIKIKKNERKLLFIVLPILSGEKGNTTAINANVLLVFGGSMLYNTCLCVFFVYDLWPI